MLKRHKKIVIFLLVLVFLGASVLYIWNNRQEQTTSQRIIEPGMLHQVQRGSLERTISAEGFIKPINEEDLTFPPNSSGSTRITNIYVEEGDVVEKGQVLMELDKTEANLRYLQRLNTYNRVKINGSQNEIEEARLNLELASNDLENMQLKAPFSGIITNIYVSVGNYYSSGEVATIKDISRLQIEISIEESNFQTVQTGQEARVSLSSLSGVVVNGQVTRVADEADNSGGVVTLPVTVTLDETDFPVILNSSAQLDIIVEQVADKLVVPITAVFSQGGNDFVVKSNNGRSETIPVETGLSSGLRIVIESGLNEGDEILINTFQQAGNVDSQNRMPGGMPVGMMGGRR
ncbi:efflux RND transporter periplasmic adaptor subunit [Natronospora cellulosivora (SeqCode)]